jgi:voltage-gated potassium channel Kch
LAALALATLGAGVAASATTGVDTTGATTVVGAVFLETVFLEAGVEAAFIILEAVEVFMAGIRIVKRCLESIFEPLFHFCRGQKIFRVTRHTMIDFSAKGA